MHKCVNNSTANVYHLEQMVGDFFPYSQEQLGFDKPATIVFQSDEGNSSKMLGKTAHYDPGAFEVVLYVDGRHPKDVMRSLSHELVHHAQNCRGDFQEPCSTVAGYAQKDPHLRNMEREAYTKGNLIFRDYEDLIKTGKKEVDIDFTKSGEPKMSLKEWKNNEINTKLMKKWGLLKEGHVHNADCGCPDQELEEGCPSSNFDPGGDEVVADEEEEEEGLEEGGMAYRDDDEEEVERRIERPYWGRAADPYHFAADSAEWPGTRRHDDQMDALEQPRGRWRGRGPGFRNRPPKRSKNVAGTKWQTAPTIPDLEPVSERNQKISVREAKQITRRIIERVRKEGK